MARIQFELTEYCAEFCARICFKARGKVGTRRKRIFNEREETRG